MSRKKQPSTSQPAPTNKLLHPSLVRILAISFLAYYLILAIIAALIGRELAMWLAAPLSGLPLYMISRWEQNRPVEVSSWREVFKLPKFNYWNLTWIVLTIFIIQVLWGFLYAVYLDSARPDFSNSVPDDAYGALNALGDDWPSLIGLLLAGAISHFCGGYIATKLPNLKCPSPYRHALAGSFIYNLFSFVSLGLFAYLKGDAHTFTEEDLGQIILTAAPYFLFSLLGVWVVVRKRRVPTTNGTPDAVAIESQDSSPPVDSQLKQAPSLPKRVAKRRRKGRKSAGQREEKQSAAQAAPETPEPPQVEVPLAPEPPSGAKVRWSRRRLIALAACGVVVAVIAVLWFRTRYKSTTAVNCPNPPTTAKLNYWPVTYSTPAEFCHDYQSVDARLAGDGHDYSRSQEEWERGLTAKAGDEIYVIVYINNGAADNAEQINPGLGIARTVRLTTNVDQPPNTVHYINVRFAGDNTEAVTSNFKINTPANERLEIVAQSGEIISATESVLIAKNLDVGNATVTVGDLPPKFNASIFVRFRLKVVA